MSFDSHIISLRTLFSPQRAGDLEASYELRLEGGTFRVEVADGVAEIGRGEPGDPDAVITGTAAHLFAVVRGVRDLTAAETAGELEVEGDRALAERFFELFPLPEPAPAA